MKTQEEKLKDYKRLIGINKAIEENRLGSKMLIWLTKFSLSHSLNIRKLKKEMRNQFIVDFLKRLEYESRKECGYELNLEQERFCLQMDLLCGYLINSL